MSNWAVKYSQAYCRFAPYDEKIKVSLKAFVKWKDSFLKRLKGKGVVIPKKSRKGQTFLETLVGIVPDEMRRELIFLIRFRERLIPLLIPLLRRVGKEFLARKLGVSRQEVTRYTTSGNFEAALAFAARQGVDRMSKVGVRIDFLLSALSRLLPEIQQERYFVRFSSERWVEQGQGEVQEWRLREFRDDDFFDV